MHFTSDVVVERSQRQVASFFAEPDNLAKWDRSVARVVPTSEGTTAVGFTFDTIAPSGLRMSYRITEHVPEERTSIALESSPMFREAVWRIGLETVSVGTRIQCDVNFTLRPLYWFLIIPLLLTQRSALRRDLSLLKDAIEAHESNAD
jgi:Polyketide cyclase / dehydrase and lipid transport